jgi:hypothetical protein
MLTAVGASLLIATACQWRITAREQLLVGVAAADRSIAAGSDDWVRTTNGWEHAAWRSVRLRRLPHPLVVGAFLLLASLLALVAFPATSAES